MVGMWYLIYVTIKRDSSSPLLHKGSTMQVLPVKSGSRGRPRFRRVNGVIYSPPSGGWYFLPADDDLFGGEPVSLWVDGNIPLRAFSRIVAVTRYGNDCEVTLAFTGKSYQGSNGEVYYDFRFVGFPSC